MVNKFIKTKLEVQSNEEVITKLGTHFLEAGFVKDTYIDAVLQREQNMPTGLNTGFMNVAIPHTDSEHVHESALAIATLKNPVSFQSMEDPTKELDVELVCLLAVKDPAEQLGLLRKLMGIFQDEDLLGKIKNAEDDNSLTEIIESALSL